MLQIYDIKNLRAEANVQLLSYSAIFDNIIKHDSILKFSNHLKLQILMKHRMR